MKQFIKTSAACLLMGLSLVSCNDNFDEGPGAITYPEKMELGIWANDLAAANDVKYTVNLTLNEQGDTICDVTTYDPVLGSANVFSNGKVSYDRRTGMLIADFADSPYEAPARVSLTYKNNLDGLTVNLFSSLMGVYKSEACFTPSKVNSVSVYGDWRMTDGTLISLNADNQTAQVSGAQGVEEATYQYAGTTGVVTTASNKVYNMALNDKGQMYVTPNGGQAVYAYHAMTALPDDWEVYAMGTYSSWFLEEAYSDVPLEYSEYRQKARISGIFAGGSGSFTFLWKKGNSAVTPLASQIETGYGANDGNGGMFPIHAVPRSISDTDSRKAYYSGAGNGIFYFGMAYGVLDLAYFWESPTGKYQDMFLVTDKAE